jgi:DNA polymerase bacteriophage-type
MSRFYEVTADFETASQCDLKKCGAWRYAEDPTTEVLCLNWKVKGDRASWVPGLPIDDLYALAEDPNAIFVAHNAQFEKAIWRNIMVPIYGLPDIPNERWIDTMASCAYKNIPLGLDEAARVLQLETQKDMDGSKLTLACSKLGKDGYYAPRDINRIVDYCFTDVDAEEELHERVGNLSRDERRVWLLDQKINERGIKIDLDFVDAAQRIVDDASVPLLAEFKEITGGLKPTQRAKYLEFLSDNGLKLSDMKKDTVEEYLDGDTAQFAFDGLPPEIERSLRIRQLTGGAAIKKLSTMRSMACADDRARGLLQYHGAGPGRWAGRLLQPQNFPRGTIDKIKDMNMVDLIVNAILSGDHEYVRAMVGEPIEVVTSGLRHALIAEKGHKFVSGDFAGIEARVVLALAGQHDKAALMAAGADVYIDMALRIYNQPLFDVTNKMLCDKFKAEHPEWRQDGKNSVLGCGFRMGAVTFRSRYCPNQPIEFAQNVIRAYREDWAPEVPKLWKGLEVAARETVWSGLPHEAYGVEFRMEGEWMTARLPSGRKLHYFHAEQCRQEMPWSTEDDPDVRATWRYYAKKNGKWVAIYMHGGVIAENVVQALARDLMVDSMFKCEAENMPIVLTVHDEILAEVQSCISKKTLHQIMEDTPKWGLDLRVPVSVESWEGDRYRK